MRRIFSEAETQDLRDANDGIAMATTAVEVAVDRLVENVVAIAPIPAPPAAYVCGGTSLLSQAQ